MKLKNTIEFLLISSLFVISGCTQECKFKQLGNQELFHYRHWNQHHISKCDLNEDGVADEKEREEFHKKWMIENEIVFANNYFYKKNGAKLSWCELAELVSKNSCQCKL